MKPFLQTQLEQLPQVVLTEAGLSERARPRLFTSVYGDVEGAFSGTLWHLAEAGMAEGVIDGVFTLNPRRPINPRLVATGAAWKLWRVLQGAKTGGFKFTRSFSDILWRQNLDKVKGCTIINTTQVFGNEFLKAVPSQTTLPAFYLDGTLKQYFEQYSEFEAKSTGPDVVERAIALEREGYNIASAIMTMSRATAKSLVEHYGVPQSKVSIVVPGANIIDRAVPSPSDHRGWRSDQFTIGFVGLYPERKGLDVLAEAVNILRSRKVPVRLRVIGRCPAAIAAMDGVEDLGIISKSRQTETFISAIRACDLGCQLSRAELAGIALMEFIRVGTPVLATAVGGVPDMLEGGGGVLVPPLVKAEALAEVLGALISDSAAYQDLRDAAVRRASWASWTRAVREMDRALGTGL